MSPYYQKTLTTVGLTLAAALATILSGGADEPRSSQTPSQAAPLPADQHLMLTNGQILKGIVQEEENTISVTQRAGVMRFPKSKVEGVFGSLREAYEYRLTQLPERDPDERMKLALWCLNLELKAEARLQLSQILKENPSNPQAKAMLISLDQAAQRLAMRQRDPEVRRTKAERPMDPDRPRALDSGVIRDAQSALGIPNTPIIFDLPRPMAIRRTEEFVRFVHPLLQAYCSKCHNEGYQGNFQLIPVKTRADRTTDAIRANLDATLRLVDPANPARSELLSSTLRAHGTGAGKRPIFPGSNDRAYQVLATWVNHLAAQKTAPESTATEPGEGEPADDFAAGRPRIGRPNGRRPAPGSSPDPSVLMKPRPLPVTPGVAETPDDGQADEDEQFPLPFAITGKKPKLPAEPGTDRGEPKAKAAIPPPSPKILDPKVNPTSNESASATAKAPGKAAEPKTKAKIKIDPAVLERALQLRNQTRPATP